jgi:hypothetical protein
MNQINPIMLKLSNNLSDNHSSKLYKNEMKHLIVKLVKIIYRIRKN